MPLNATIPIKSPFSVATARAILKADDRITIAAIVRLLEHIEEQLAALETRIDPVAAARDRGLYEPGSPIEGF